MLHLKKNKDEKITSQKLIKMADYVSANKK